MGKNFSSSFAYCETFTYHLRKPCTIQLIAFEAEGHNDVNEFRIRCRQMQFPERLRSVPFHWAGQANKSAKTLDFFLAGKNTHARFPIAAGYDNGKLYVV